MPLNHPLINSAVNRYPEPSVKAYITLGASLSILIGLSLACIRTGQAPPTAPPQNTQAITFPDMAQPPTVTPVYIELPAQPLTDNVPANPAPAAVGKIKVFVHPDVPASLKAGINPLDLFALTDDSQKADLTIQVGSQRVISVWIYALVTPFPTIPGGVTRQDVEQAWRGQPSGPFAGKPLLMDDETRRVLTAFWGQPASGAIQVIEASSLVNTAWDQRPSWAIVPFEALEPRWKVLTIDGNSPIRKSFDPTSYFLSIPISLEGEAQVADLAAQMFGPAAGNRLVPSTNRDPSKLATLAMTGVTALVRATAYAMETQGINYPATDIGDWLREADLTHVSNEVPFAQDCPYPNPVQAEMRFCSNPRYIELLETISTDIVEMSGDHFADWGPDAMLYTLDLYKQRGWLYYGGGANLEEGRKAITLEYHGNRLAFIGCNGKGGSFATASATNPGAVPCDFNFMHAEITRLRSEGYLPIATFQHFEYYTYQAQPDQIRDFRGMAEAGAVIVSGSQAHQPQAIEFYPEETPAGGTSTSPQGGFIHYGLGNLFFDQYDVSQACRQAFIDRHVFYDNRYISTELLPMMFVDYARPRPMTADEEAELLQSVFSASGW
jgi:hypothetical protein